MTEILLTKLKLFLKKYWRPFKRLQKQSHKDRIKQLSHQRNTTIYPAEPVIAQLPKMLANGMSPEEIKRRILFTLLSHELGPCLRSTDIIFTEVLILAIGIRESDDKHSLKSSSIMDYIHIKDEASAPLKAVWGPYDEAAHCICLFRTEKKICHRSKRLSTCSVRIITDTLTPYATAGTKETLLQK